MLGRTAVLLTMALWAVVATGFAEPATSAAPSVANATASKSAKASTDSTHFVTASILTVSPGAAVYSVFGHTAIRMQCPSKGLDYCFSFESEPTFDYYLRFFAGKANATFVAIPTVDYLSEYEAEGRGVTQYELNLTPHEKQELWRSLDEDMVEGPHRKFNLLQNNCTSMSMFEVESILQDEYIDFGKMPAPMYYNNGKGIEYLSRRSPWAQFLFMMFIGSEADDDWSVENKISPELMASVLNHSVIRNTDNKNISRPTLTGNSKVLLPLRNTYAEISPFTPNRVFGALLVISAIILLLVEVLCKEDNAAIKKHVAWNVFAVVYFFISIFLLFVTTVSGLFGVHWNWLLIPFSVIPFFVCLAFRKKQYYNKVYIFYAVVLALFICIVPWLTCQLMLAHYLIVGTMCLLCLSHYLRLQAAPVVNKR